MSLLSIDRKAVTLTRARDLFAGIGWAVAAKSLRLQEHGWDWDEDVVRTRTVNGFITMGRDVREVYGAVGRYDLEIGSPPCERFTSSGHGDGTQARDEIVRIVLAMKEPADIYRAIIDLDRHHEKIGLVLEPFRVLLENPYARAAVWEQVPPVLPIWQAIGKKLADWGWSVSVKTVNASWYGVPQDRRRSILLARRDHAARIPGEMDKRIMRDVFPDRHGWVQRSNYSAPSAYVGQTAQERGRTMRTMDQLSVTMTRKAAQWVHPDGSITKMTVADMAAVQTFPDGMKFTGGLISQRLQIGNAVPPTMAEALIKAAIDT